MPKRPDPDSMIDLLIVGVIAALLLFAIVSIARAGGVA